MPEISRFFGIRITMYYADHQPPHFHAQYGDDKALVDIENGVITDNKEKMEVTKKEIATTYTYEKTAD